MRAGSSAWMFADVRGEARIGQYVQTRLLRFKVVLFYRPVRRFLRLSWSRSHG